MLVMRGGVLVRNLLVAQFNETLLHFDELTQLFDANRRHLHATMSTCHNV